jgi:1-deoxy-D-xylulose-5-phosphate reductoisomerase
MSSISGLDGLEPTIKIIKYTKKIAIANKEVNYLWMESY